MKKGKGSFGYASTDKELKMGESQAITLGVVLLVVLFIASNVTTTVVIDRKWERVVAHTSQHCIAITRGHVGVVCTECRCSVAITSVVHQTNGQCTPLTSCTCVQHTGATTTQPVVACVRTAQTSRGTVIRSRQAASGWPQQWPHP